jgi:hypothetical protein
MGESKKTKHTARNIEFECLRLKTVEAAATHGGPQQHTMLR